MPFLLFLAIFNYLKNEFYDVIIIGAGPAGSASAISLSTEPNLKILVVDKENFPRDKICGDGLTGDSIRCLKEIGVWEKVKNQGNSMNRIELYPFSDSRHFTIASEIITLQRKKLDHLLLNEALMNKNASFKRATFKGIIQEEAGICKTTLVDASTNQEIIIDSKFVIIAIGCQNDKSLFKTRKLPYKQPDLVALRGYYQANWKIVEPLVIFFDFSKKGYFWVFPMGDGIFNVGCGNKTNLNIKTDIKKILADNIEFLNQKHETRGEWKTEPKGAFLRTGLNNYKKMPFNNIIFAGESISSTYQFTGEGIGKALETGILASKSIIDSINKKNRKSAFYYRDLLTRQVVSRYMPYRVADVIFTKKHLSVPFYNVLCKSKRAQRFVSNILSEKTMPSKFFIFKTIFQLIFQKRG